MHILLVETVKGKNMRTIDIHAHIVPGKIAELQNGDDWHGFTFTEDSGQPFLIRDSRRYGLHPKVLWSPEQRLAEMDSLGVDVHVLSTWTGIYNYDLPLEVCAATIGPPTGVHLWNGEDGTTLPGWPQLLTNTSINSSPAIGDLDNDGLPEILVAGTDVTNFRATLVWAWNVDGSLVEGFPFRILGFRNRRVHQYAVAAQFHGD